MLIDGKVKVAVARVIKPHGINGELNVELLELAEPEEDFAPGSCIIVEIDGLDVPFFVKSSRPKGSQSYLISFDDLNSDSEAAELLQSQTLYVYADADEIECDSFQASQLIGYEIFDINTNSVAGIIDALIELTPGCWYFEVDNRMIPAVNDLIINVDSERKVIIMNLPDGLLEL